MVGSATFTTVMSRMTMNWARHSSTSAHQRRGSEAGRCGAPAWTGGMLPAGRAEWSLIGSSLLLLMRADRVALVLGLVLPWLGCTARSCWTLGASAGRGVTRWWE